MNSDQLNQKFPSSDKASDRPLLVSNNALERYVGKQNLIVNALAPWCPHCKEFAPVYDQFTSQWLSEHPQIVPVNYNAYKNKEQLHHLQIGKVSYGHSISEAIRGYPTIMFLRKDGKAVIYGGERSVESMKSEAGKFFEVL